MNLHSIVFGAIGSVNPHVAGVLRVSTGFTTAADGQQVPTYAAPANITVQDQPLSVSDLKQLDALNIQGVTRAAYLFGDVQGVVRVDQKGGDLLAFNNRVWLVAAVIETWDTPGWCKVGLTLQMDAPA